MNNPCEDCRYKNCEVCIHGGENTKLDVTDSYRQSVKTGYYSTTIIPVKGKDGKIYYVYVKPGE